jgi:ornithine cyclodeaminase
MYVIGGRKLREIVPMHDAIAAVRAAFIASAEGLADQPQRLVSHDGTALAMVVRVAPEQHTLTKVLTVLPNNPAIGLPRIHAIVVWFDGETGRPTMLIDGSDLTALRTGAASGVATDLLAPPDASVLALFGAGAQAADQVDAVCAVREIRDVSIITRSGTRAELLAERLRNARPMLRVRVARSAAEALSDADVICCATPSTQPLFRIGDMKETVHINAIGAHTPSMCEVGPDVLAASRVIAVDEIDAARAEAGDIIQARTAGAIEDDSIVAIGTLLTDDQALTGGTCGVTVFKSVGIAVQDWAVAQRAYQAAEQHPQAVSSIELTAKGYGR